MSGRRPAASRGVFFQRYDGHAKKNWSYRHECGAGGTFRATWVTPSFFNKESTATEKVSKKEAERSAAVCFCQNAEAIEATKHLPPLMDKVRRHVVNSLLKPLKTSLEARRLEAPPTGAGARSLPGLQSTAVCSAARPSRMDRHEPQTRCQLDTT